MRAFLFSLLLIVSLNLVAQSHWQFGVGTGLNSSQIHLGWSESSAGFSPTGGLVAYYNLNRRVSLQSEVNYLLVKCRVANELRVDGALAFKTDFKFSFNYFEVPILMNYAFLIRKRVSFSTGVGGAFRHALKSNMEGKVTPYSTTGVPTIDYRSPAIDLADNINFVLISPVIQSTVEFKKLNSQAFRFIIRYSASLNAPLKTTPNELLYNYGIKFSDSNRLQTLSLSFQYQIGLR